MSDELRSKVVAEILRVAPCDSPETLRIAARGLDLKMKVYTETFSVASLGYIRGMDEARYFLLNLADELEQSDVKEPA